MDSHGADLDLDQQLTRLMEQALERGLPVDDLAVAVSNAAAESGRLIADDLRDSAPAMRAEHETLRLEFETELRRYWGEALDLFYATVVAATETGEATNERYAGAASRHNFLPYAALSGLFARACLTAHETYVLLSSGYPTGAAARARTLHELSVVAYVLAEKAGDSDLVERYLAHEAIDSYHSMRDYQEHAPRLGYELMDEQEVEAVIAERDCLVSRFGRPYSTQYGWAADFLGKPRPSFRDLEEIAGLHHMRPHYRWFSHSVHATSRGLTLNVQQGHGEQWRAVRYEMRGLADPGHAALIALVQVATVTVLRGRPPQVDQRPTDVIGLSSLIALEGMAGHAFIQAHQRLETDLGNAEHLP